MTEVIAFKLDAQRAEVFTTDASNGNLQSAFDGAHRRAQLLLNSGTIFPALRVLAAVRRGSEPTSPDRRQISSNERR